MPSRVPPSPIPAAEERPFVRAQLDAMIQNEADFPEEADSFSSRLGLRAPAGYGEARRLLRWAVLNDPEEFREVLYAMLETVEGIPESERQRLSNLDASLYRELLDELAEARRPTPNPRALRRRLTAR